MKKSLTQTTLVAVLTAIFATGCATPSFTTGQAKVETSKKMNDSISQFAESKPSPKIREISIDHDFRKVERPKTRGDVNVKMASSAFGPVINSVAQKNGYSIAFADDVDITKKVTAEFNNASAEDVIRSTCFLAGYVAVFNKEERQIFVAQTASYTFKLPSNVVSNLKASYNVGGNPANASASSGGSGGAGGSGGGTSLKAEFVLSGTEGEGGQESNKVTEAFQAAISTLAGKSAEVFVTKNGLVTVRANAQSLRRVHNFLKQLSRDAATQVEIETSIIEVGLSNQFSLGIQWGRVLDSARGAFGGMNPQGANALLNGAANNSTVDMMKQIGSGANASSLSLWRSNDSSSAIIQALASFTNVEVISEPHIVTMNNTGANFFDGLQVPYLGSSQQTAGSSTTAQPTVTGTLAFAIDGISFSAIPSVIDDNNVQITLVPVLSKVGDKQSFLNGTLQAYIQSNKQSFMRALATNGQTLILGGIRYKTSSANTSLAASTGSQSGAKEVVILLRTNIMRPTSYDPIIDESI